MLQNKKFNMKRDVDLDAIESDSEIESVSDEHEDTGLTENQNRLLYLVFMYSHRALIGTDEKDQWIRKQALIVLTYEGIFFD